MRALISTAIAYKENYNSELEYHRLEYGDNNEMSFIKEESLLIRKIQGMYISPISIIEYVNISDLINFYNEFELTNIDFKIPYEEQYDDYLIHKINNCGDDYRLLEHAKICYERINMLNDIFDFKDYKEIFENLKLGRIERTLNAIIDFLNDREYNLKRNTTKEVNTTTKELNEVTEELNEVTTDTDEVVKRENTEKMVYLNELGIIELLQNKIGKHAVSKIAEVIHLFTGDKLSTVTGSVSRLINSPIKDIKDLEGIKDRNHPYKSKRKVEKAKKRLEMAINGIK